MATDINILIKATDQASPAIKKVEGEVKGLGTTAKSSSSLLGGMGNILKTGLTTALVGTVAAVGGLAFAFKDSIGAATEAIQGQKQLAAVLTSTNYAAGVTVDAANELAGSLAKVTNFQDDAITAGQSLLLTFTGIGKDVFPRATETMLDMSQALGQDLSSSAVQLGKALNDPVNGMTALSRVGVSFTDQQKEMIKTMQNANDIAGAQGVILDELSKEFGGSAKAMADPITQLSNAWGEVQEAVGTFIIPLLTNLAKTVMPYVNGALDTLNVGLGAFYDALDSGDGYVVAFTDAIRAMLPEDMQPKFDELIGNIAGTFNTITGNVQNAMGWIKLAWDTNWGGMQTTWADFQTKALADAKEFNTQFSREFSTGEGGIKVDWEGLWGGLASYSSMRITNMIENATAFFRVLHDIWDGFSALFKGDWQGFWTNIKDIFSTVWELMIRDMEQKFGTGLTTAFENALGSVWTTLQNWWANIVSWWNSTVGSLPGVGGLSLGSLPTPNFAVVNPQNTVDHRTTNQVGAIHVYVNGGGDPYQTGQQVGQGVNDELRIRGH